MKACVLEDIGKLVYKDVAIPDVLEEEVLIKIKVCGICSSDIPRIFRTGTYHFPTIPGHEISGEIVDIGRKVNKDLIGQRVVVFPMLPCKKCSYCRAGDYSKCVDYNYFGSRCDGGFAEYLAVPVWNVMLFSERLPYITAALCEPASVARHSVRTGKVRSGDKVAVVGTGTIGMLAAFWAKEFGAEKVSMIGRNRAKLDIAKKIGVDSTIDISVNSMERRVQKPIEEIEADVVLECVGSSQAVNQAISAAKKGGRVVLTGNPEGDIQLKKDIYWKILRGELEVLGTWNSTYGIPGNDWKATLEFMENGRFPAEELITHIFPLSMCHDALKTVQSKEICSIKVMIEG